MDVHAKASIAVAIDGGTGEVLTQRFGPDVGQIVAWAGGLAGRVEVAYEAGPTGYVLYRALEQAGIGCRVVAPSKLSRPSGDRVKTDRRDAEHLARLLQVGQLVVVHVPSPGQEAARDLVRARDDARRDLSAARHRLGKLLLRHGVRYPKPGLWTKAHLDWLRTQGRQLGLPALRAAFDAAYDQLIATTDLRGRLDTLIGQMASDSEFTPIVNRLGCLRGVATLTAFALAVEVGDWTRLDGRRIGAYFGLVPTEHSTGGRRAQGGITKTGNSHVRRLLIEAAWHHKKPYHSSSKTLRERWDKAPADARRRGHQANQRLHRQWEKFDERHKNVAVANTAIARELAGWCWSLATLH